MGTDPEEENLKTVYFALLDYFEEHNPEKMTDEDALAVLLDYWIDYGLEALNRLLRRKYKKGIENVVDPYVGGLLARKERTRKGGWPYPSNHPQYKDPLAPMIEVDDSVVLPPPKRSPNAPKKEEQRMQQKPKQRRDQKQRSSTNEKKPREKKPREEKSESSVRRKREDRGGSARMQQPSSSRGGPRGARGEQREAVKSTRKAGQNVRQQPGSQVGRDKDVGKSKLRKRHESLDNKEALRRSKHYKERTRQRNQSTRAGPQRPKFGQFQSLQEFDNPSDVKLSAQHHLEAFYGRFNREVLISSTGVTALVKWVEAHSIEEFNRNLKKKYGSTTEDAEVRRDAIRRKNIETVLVSLYEFHDKSKLRKAELSQMVTKVITNGVEQLNKEIRQYNKNPRA